MQLSCWNLACLVGACGIAFLLQRHKVLETEQEDSSAARQRCLLGLQDAPLPLFDQIKADDVVPGITALVDELNSELDALEVEVGKTEPTWASLVEPLERLTDRISRAWGAVSHLKVCGACLAGWALPWAVCPSEHSLYITSICSGVFKQPVMRAIAGPAHSCMP